MPPSVAEELIPHSVKVYTIVAYPSKDLCFKTCCSRGHYGKNLKPVRLLYCLLKNGIVGTSMVVQWLRLSALPRQGTWVLSLVMERRSHMTLGMARGNKKRNGIVTYHATNN